MIALMLLALGLAADAFAVAIATGASARPGTGDPTSRILRIALAFGLAQGLMPLGGYALSAAMGSWFESVDHWIAFGLLALIGGRMVKAGLDGSEDEAALDTTSLAGLLIAAIATSIDAAAAGLTLPLLGPPILVSCLVIGVCTAVLSALGAGFGARLGLRFGTRAEVAGGLVLIAIGARILHAHLTA